MLFFRCDVSSRTSNDLVWKVYLKLRTIQTVIIPCIGHRFVWYLTRKIKRPWKARRWGSLEWFSGFFFYIIKCVTCAQCKRSCSSDIALLYPLRLTFVLKISYKNKSILAFYEPSGFHVKYTYSYYWVYLSRKALGIFNVSPTCSFYVTK